MPQPEQTSNSATVTRPAQSAQEVARKAPLGWLPWALLAALVALLALTFLVVNAIDDEGGGAVAAAGPGEVNGAEKLTERPGTAGTVLFAEGSAQIDSAGQEVVRGAAKALKDAGVRSLDVTGHTDKIAGDPLNDPLSQQRADNVAAALRELLPGVEVTTSATGQDEPVASNDSEQGRQLNRRAVITARG